MRIRRLSFTFVITLLSAMGLARAEAPTPVTSADFARSASEHFTAQLQAARTAQNRSKDAKVRQFASQLASHYESAGRSLSQICEELNLDVLPQPGGAPSTAGAAAPTPRSFDRVYTLEVTQHLAKAETAFDAAIQSPKVDPKLKDFARNELGAIREYRQMAAPLARSEAVQGGR